MSAVARLPKAIRDQLNQNLADGVPGVRVVEWLNTLPEVQKVLTEQFDGREINEPNLSEWKAGGFLDWQARHYPAEPIPASSETPSNRRAAPAPR